MSEFKYFFISVVAIFVLISKSQASLNSSYSPGQNDDPFTWLEEITGPKSLAWVEQHNKSTLSILENETLYASYFSKMKNLVNDKDRIAYGTIRDGYVYNFWQDKKNIRGLWRRTKLKDYQIDQPQWEKILDFDALAKSENENWVYQFANCNPEELNRCLIGLSRGGKDAAVVREFDINTKSFVANGFYLKEAKSNVDWLDKEHILVATDFGPNSLTNSGYPRFVKKWKRGTALSRATLIFEVNKTDNSSWSWPSYGSGGDYVFIGKSINFYKNELYVYKNKSLREHLFLPIQDNAKLLGVFKEQLLVQLRSDWKYSNSIFKSGDVLSIDLKIFFRNKTLPKPNVLFSANSKQTFRSLRVSKNSVLISLLEDVQAKAILYKYENKQWIHETLDMPLNGSLSFYSVDPASEYYFLNYESFLIPDQLYLGKDTQSKPQMIKKSKTKFNANNLKVEQFFATSKDGTKVPYFQVGLKKLNLNGKNKTLLYGYGGFEVSLLPRYSGASGQLWLENGGVYVLANIRGGGEYGPRWHQAALLEKRQKAFDDFIAIGEDLVERGITSPQHLGIMGGSNGGLLVGAATMQRPDLFNAVICQVPLLDMLNYHKLLAGASWMAEYGNPDSKDPLIRSALESYSPYHNLEQQKKYPEIFFITSTKDDRVHPAHARKMAAKMESMGHPFYYYENIDGGHSGSANRIEIARRTALEYVYLEKMLDSGAN